MSLLRHEDGTIKLWDDAAHWRRMMREWALLWRMNIRRRTNGQHATRRKAGTACGFFAALALECAVRCRNQSMDLATHQ